LLERANENKGRQIEERRAQVLNLAQAGKSKPEIADELGVSVSTVKRDIYALNGQINNHSSLGGQKLP
jgi:DNA-binding NarL/FixJ family response regulator